ncbi:uncharacterized protein LOC141854197 [Brevipalpus obovatus]|uniref:uncharacterized protein LOC141854197 n=1 Tax=Brevipalpus obovatus TaxID=246614 RepID=UPI003D9E812E
MIKNLTTILSILMTFLHVGSSGQSQVEAVIGSTAELPCITSAPHDDDDVQLILWYRTNDGTGPPFYTVDARSTDFVSKASHKIVSNYLGRVFFSLSSPQSFSSSISSSSEPSILSISPVREDDAGDYSCRVDYKWGRTSLSSQKLFVIMPPNEVTISEVATGKRANSLLGPYPEGSRLQLSCSAGGGKPPPSLIWYRDNQLIDDSFTVDNESERVENVLTIENLTRDYLYSVLTCRAHNHPTLPAISASTRLDLYTKPTHVKIIHRELPPKVDQKVEMECLANGSKPPSSIFWYLGKEMLKNYRSSLSSSDQTAFSSVSFTPLPSHNGLPLICKAVNPKMPNISLTDEWYLDIQFKPILNLTLVGNQSHAVLFKQVQLFCDIKANPDVSDVQWFYENRPLERNSSKDIIIVNTTLTMNITSTDRKGVYQCRASNSHGTSWSNPLDLQIFLEPKCLNGQNSMKSIYEAAIQETINISCPIHPQGSQNNTNTTTSISYWWQFIADSSKSHFYPRSAEILSSSSYHRKDITIKDGSPQVSNKVIIFHVNSYQDYGTITCGIQDQKDNCSFRIEPVIKLPLPPEKCHLLHNSSELLYLIKCIPASLRYKTGVDRGNGAIGVTGQPESSINELQKIRNADSGGKESTGHDEEYFLEVYSDHRRSSTPIVMMNDQQPHFKISASELPSNESNIFVIFTQNSNGKSAEIVLSTETHKMLGSEANRTGTHYQTSHLWPILLVLVILGLLALSTFVLRLTKWKHQREGQAKRSDSLDDKSKKASSSSKSYKVSPKSPKVRTPDVIPLTINGLEGTITMDKNWQIDDPILLKGYLTDQVNINLADELSTKLHVQLLSNDLTPFDQENQEIAAFQMEPFTILKEGHSFSMSTPV